MVSVTVGSYNVLHPLLAVKWKQEEGLNALGKELSLDECKKWTNDVHSDEWIRASNWDEGRLDWVASVLQESTLDICSLQEVSQSTVQQIAKKAGYLIALYAPHEKEKIGNCIHGTAVLYKEGRVTPLMSQAIAHKSEQGVNRQAVCSLFRVADKVIRVVACHITGYNLHEKDADRLTKAKAPGGHQLTHYLNELEKNQDGFDLTVVAGDLNESPKQRGRHDDRLAFFKKKGYQCDENTTPTLSGKGLRIDWVFGRSPHKVELSPVKKEDVLLEEGLDPEGKASDHRITGTCFKFL